MELAVLCGLPASGKSSFYRARLAATHDLVSKDLLRNNRRPARRQAQLVAAALAAGRSVAVDNTNVTRELRRELLDLGRARGAGVVLFYFPAALADCRARNAARLGKERVPDVGLFAMAKALEPPAADEGYDRLFVVTPRDGDFDVREWSATRESSGG